MKTIEEKEREYAESTWPNNLEKQTSARLGYRAGAIAEHAELTRWNDLKEVLPPTDEEVLIRVRNKNKEGGIWLYDLASLDGSEWSKRAYTWEDIIGWRKIE